MCHVCGEGREGGRGEGLALPHQKTHPVSLPRHLLEISGFVNVDRGSRMAAGFLQRPFFGGCRIWCFFLFFLDTTHTDSPALFGPVVSPSVSCVMNVPFLSQLCSVFIVFVRLLSCRLVSCFGVVVCAVLVSVLCCALCS